MKNLIIKVIYVLTFVSVNIANAQLFTNYTTSDGLPDNYICGGIAIDTNNIKWFGTASGVAKYNDTTWTIYKLNQGLIDTFINCIAVDVNNYVWVGTANGISKFNGATWSSYTTTDGLIDNTVYYIAGDLDGSVWFATFSGVSKFNGSAWTNFTSSNGLPSDVITYITIDSSGNKWFATDMGLVKYNGSSFTTISTSNMDSLLDNNISSIAMDQAGNKWIGTWYGITKINTSDIWLANYRASNGLYHNFIRDIDIDSKGNIWVGMFADYIHDGGISRYNGSNWISYTTAQGLADKQVIRLAVDNDDNVWIATGNGVSKLFDNSGINNIEQKNTYKIYPNPAKDILFVNHENSIQVRIYDILGHTIISQNLPDNSDKIDINGLVQGVYILQINEENKVYNTKLLVL
ncbi:MAG: T9SS type A sorting domain-containing protein [Bacteroidia bacterium]|nr:T9SS type A sorting domain-containing protein [Bacteroidia bacterium]